MNQEADSTLYGLKRMKTNNKPNPKLLRLGVRWVPSSFPSAPSSVLAPSFPPWSRVLLLSSPNQSRYLETGLGRWVVVGFWVRSGGLGFGCWVSVGCLVIFEVYC